MELLWIPISMFAGLIQAVRTAAQKDLNAHLSTVVTTYVRSIFGFPFILAYLACLVIFLDEALPRVHVFFFLNAFGAAITQLLATAFLIHLFTLRNFAVGTNLTRTDVMMTAIIGSLFFSEDLSISGWIAITLTVIGVIIMSVAKSNIGASLNSRGDLANALLSRSTLIGLLTGFCFCLSYLFLREASLSLEGSFILRAATTLVCVLGIQVLIGLVWLYRFEPEAVAKIGARVKLCTFVGITSALGSIGWFTAMTLQNASYVRAVAQVEAIFIILISVLYFREKILFSELIGIATIVAGILLFVL